MTTSGEESAGDPAWISAEQHITERVRGLTMWEAERWATSYEKQTARISLMANRVTFLEAGGGSPESDYLIGAFARIDAAIAQLDWVCSAGNRFSVALAETTSAVAAVARYALTTVVLVDEEAGPLTHR